LQPGPKTTKAIGRPVSTVQKALVELEKQGLGQIVGSGKGSRGSHDRVLYAPTAKGLQLFLHRHLDPAKPIEEIRMAATFYWRTLPRILGEWGTIRECHVEDLALKVFMKWNPRENEDPERAFYEIADNALSYPEKVRWHRIFALKPSLALFVQGSLSNAPVERLRSENAELKRKLEQHEKFWQSLKTGLIRIDK